MRWPWQKREKPAPIHPADHPFAQLWSAQNPPIPLHERIAARQRLDAPSPSVTIGLPDGTSFEMLTGTVDFDDYRKADGYLVRPVGFDRWGYRSDADGKGEV